MNSEPRLRDKIAQKFHQLARYRYSIINISIIIALSIYIIKNWQDCISMQFFSEFDGNNILFLVWIALIIVTTYDVDAKGVKFRTRKIEEAREELDRVGMMHQVQQRQQELQTQFQNESTYQTEGSDE
ncbi:hypothetical protein B5F17_12505 [Butyricicoccus pullicaecorum]|uniref:Uncharacterized protein n=1 Tax=Butyricicoccus pullicaecorum TaxID=501571 RepID=A0A1Y4LBW9_9FIRM|nr:hypothetical protein [Butyricicoccus pullicaecorum]OUP51542.1 hypothetical protein B5F17_12505 [Butyricicoccus pullicaecorum]